MSEHQSRRPRRHDSLVARLVDDARPVRRIWPPSRRLTAWTLGTLVVMTGFATRNHLPDLGSRMGEPLFAAQITSLAIAALWCAWLTFRSGVPGQSPSRTELGATVLLVGLPALLAFAQAAEAIADAGTFARGGLMCTQMTLALAALPWAGALVALYRSASLTPHLAAALAAGAALLAAAATMRAACPAGDARWHLLVWHLMPIGAGAAVSATLASEWVRFWRRRVELPER